MSTLRHVADIEKSLDVTVLGFETTKEGAHEDAYMYGDNVFYSETPFTRHVFHATGFELHQNGGTIRGLFPEAIELVTVETNEGGEQTEVSFDEADFARAVLAKLGTIPQFEGALLAAAGA